MRIKVKKTKDDPNLEFDVEVIESDSKSHHKVTMGRDFYEGLNTDVDSEIIIEKSFEFLLDRESKESILSSFDITVISRYFPEYLKELKNIINQP